MVMMLLNSTLHFLKHSEFVFPLVGYFFLFISVCSICICHTVRASAAAAATELCDFISVVDSSTNYILILITLLLVSNA
jgi:hypothetical protein